MSDTPNPNLSTHTSPQAAAAVRAAGDLVAMLDALPVKEAVEVVEFLKRRLVESMRKAAERRQTLTLREARAVLKCQGGCDVASPDLAATLRGIEERTGSRYIVIVPAMGDYPATERRPYFGCMATREGFGEARRIVGQPVPGERARKEVANV